MNGGMTPSLPAPSAAPVPASPFSPPPPAAAPQPPSSPSAGTDWDSVVQDFAAQQKQQATGNLSAAKQISPDHAAMAQTLAPVLGVPAAAIQSDPQMWTDQFKARADNAVMASDDNLQNWVAASPNNANVASDDIQKLGVFGRAAQAFNDATMSSQANQLEASVGAGIASPMQVDMLQTLKGELAARQQAESGQKPAGFIGQIAAGAGSFAQGIVGAGPDIAAGAAAGAIRGGIVGSVEPGGGTLLGAGVGALAGAGAGLVYGMAGNAAVDQYGQQMAATEGLTDQYGKPVSILVRQSTALLSALAVGGLYTVGGEAAGPVVRDLATGMAVRPALAAVVTKFATGAIKSGLVNAAVNSGIGFTQAIAPQIVQAMASPDYKTTFNDPEARRKLVQGTLDDFENGLALGVGLHIPMAGTSFLGDALRADQASRSVGQWSQMQDAAGASATRQRSPDAFADLMRTYDGNGSVFVPGDRMAELYQGMQTHPGAPNDPFASFVPDMQAQLTRAQLSGGDVEIPAAEFTAKLAGTDIERQLRPDIRFAPDGFTLREAMDFRNSNAAPMDLGGLTDEDAGDVGADHRGEAIQAVKSDITDQLRRAGFTPDVAEQYATLLGARYGARGDDFAQSPLDLYRAEGIEVERADQPRVGPRNYTALDEAIDGLRRGDKQPTDKQLYGPSLLEYLTGGSAAKRGAPGAELSGAGQREAAGGLQDETGDLAEMGADEWHLGKVGQRKLVNPNGMRLEEAAQRAHEAGYFPEHAEPPDTNDFLGAVHDELNGNPRYAEPDTDTLARADHRSVSEQLQQFLDEKGVDLKKTNNAKVKALLDKQAQGEEEPAGFFQKAKQVLTGKPRELQQSAPVGARGSITLGDGQRLVRLFKGADKSTFLHEMGHQFLDEMMRDADREDAPQKLIDDAAGLRKWLGIKDGEYPTVDAHEQFAGGFETYLMEGKAPSLELRLAFQKFAAWLTRIYRTIAGIGVPINDDIRDIMDRLLATDDAIAEARGGLAIRNPLFRTPADMGVTAGEYAHYENAFRKSGSDQYDRVLKRAMRVEVLKRKKEWRENAEAMRPDAEVQVKSRPVLQAWYALKYGKDILNPDNEVMAGKLDRAAARDILGNSFQKLPRDIMAAEGGIHPDMLAPAFGYDSGEAMLRDLVNENVGREEAAAQSGKPLSLSRYISKLVDQALDERLEQHFGDPMTDGTIEEEALKAAHNESQRDVMSMELRALAKQAGQKLPFTRQHLDAWVKSDLAGTGIARATRVAMYRRAEAKAGRDAERALLAKKSVEAFHAKQRQAVAHSYATEAQRLQETFDRTTTYWRNVAKSATRPGTAQAFLNQVHGILDRLGVNIRRDPGELGRALEGKPLDRFVGDSSRQGYDLAVPSFLMEPRFNQHYQDLTSDQFGAARDAVTSLLKAGREQQSVNVLGRRMELNDIADQVQDASAELPNKAKPDKYLTTGHAQAALNNVRSFLDGGVAALRMAEHVFVQLDGGKAGPLTKLVFDPMKAAAERKREMLRLKNDIMSEALDGMPKGYADSLKNQVELRGLIDPKTGKNMTLTRDNLLALAMNIGNQGEDSNLAKLADGFGWDREAVIPALEQVLSKSDFDFLQKMGDLYETYREPLDEMSRDMTGVGLKFVEATPFSTLHGDYRGWYFPVILDRLENQDVFMKEDDDTPFGGNQYFRATTRSGSTIARNSYKGPLAFDLRNVATKVDQTIHDIAFRRAVTDGWKIINNKRVRQTIIDKMGQDHFDQLNGWLRSIARSANTDDKALQGLNRVMRYIRVGLGSTFIPFNWTVAALHGPTAVLHGMGEAGAKHWFGAAKDLLGSLYSSRTTQKFVHDNSSEVRQYVDHLNLNAQHNMRRLLGQDTMLAEARSKAEVMGEYVLNKFLHASSQVVFLARYRQAVDEGMEQADAVAEGNRAVRFAHGGKDVMDKAGLFQIGGEFVRGILQFGSFLNVMFNRSVDTVNTGQRGVRAYQRGDKIGAKRDFADFAAKAFTYWFLTSALDAGVRGQLQGQKSQDQSWASYYLEMFTYGRLDMIPGLGAGAQFLFGGGHSITGSPASQALEEVKGTGKDVLHLAEGVPVSKRWLEHGIETVGTFAHLPGGLAVGRAAQSVLDDLDGDSDPQGLTDFIKGLLMGPPKGQ